MSYQRNPLNVVLDIETLGTASDAAIIQIGMCVPEFDRVYLKDPTNYEFEVTIAYDSCLLLVKEGVVSMTDSTMEWWEKQPTRERVFSGQSSYIECLFKAVEWLERLTSDGNICVWGNGSDFDNVILLHSLSCFNIKAPWDFRNNRDLRTLKGLFPLRVKLAPYLSHSELLHTALGDARYEARLLHETKQEYSFALKNL